MSRSFRIALAQCESVVGTEDRDPRPANLDRLARAVDEAVSEGAELVLFGEMFLTGYRTDEWNGRWALHLDGPMPDPTLAGVSEIAAASQVQVMVGAATHSPTDPGVVHDSALLVSGEGLMGTYHKLHAARFSLPSGEEVNEFAFFTPGNEAPVWETELGVVGPQVCYDSSFPEISRTQSLKGAEVLLNISASVVGFEARWEQMRAVRAFENSAWYAVCSVVGEQKGERYFGRSAVVDPFGNTVVEAKDGDEDLVVAEICPDDSSLWRERMNTMAARRPDAYRM